VLAPVVEEIAKEYSGRLKIVGANAHENYDMACEFGVTAIPTLIFFKEGKEVLRTVGSMKKEKLIEVIQKNLGL